MQTIGVDFGYCYFDLVHRQEQFACFTKLGLKRFGAKILLAPMVACH